MILGNISTDCLSTELFDPDTGLSLEEKMHNIGDDNSQQAAMAMVQLSGQGPPISQDESFDSDPNYDPSDFLAMSSIKKEPMTTDITSEIDIDNDDMVPMDVESSSAPVGIHEDLAISDSDDEDNGMMLQLPNTTSDSQSMVATIEESPTPTSAESKVDYGNATNTINQNDDDEDNGNLWF